MTPRKNRAEIERRLDAVRLKLSERHAGIEPDALFAARVLARLPGNATWSIGWAARHVLPVSVALALVLIVAIVATGRGTDRKTATTSVLASPQSGADPLEWLLEDRQELR